MFVVSRETKLAIMDYTVGDTVVISKENTPVLIKNKTHKTGDSGCSTEDDLVITSNSTLADMGYGYQGNCVAVR